MGKFFSLVSFLLLIIACALLPSCGGGKATTVAPEIAPSGVSINPSPTVSLEVGKTQAFTATPASDPFTYQSSNPTVVTVANNGLACAGTWNSLSAPTVCSPGSVGSAQVTATTLGVTSTPVTIYVHAPITGVTISKVTGQPQTLRDDCISKGTIHGPEKWLFQANAFNGTTDITSSVGPVTFQQINPGVGDIVNLASLPNGAQGCLLSPQGQCLNQQTATANVPGVSQIYATASGFSSAPISIETCPVQSISIAANGDVPSHTSFVVNSGTTTTLNATVTDIAGQSVTGVPLTWSTSNPVSVPQPSINNTGTVYGSIGTVGSSGVGAGTVIASCTPPTCNAGIKPSLPIYPQAAINFEVQSTTAPAAPTVYATTTACADPIANPSGASCTPTLVPITRSSATAAFAAGGPVSLLSSPGSFVYDNNGTNAYIGVDSADFGMHGLMIFSGTSVTQVPSLPGKVLAISPDRNSVIISDTVDSPNQVFICSNCGGTGRTVTSLLITGATAAAFSPDNLKAYIVAGNTVYVYSKVDPLQTIALSPAVGTDVVFHPEGGFAYIAESSPAVTPYRSCDNSVVPGQSLPTLFPPTMIRALPDGQTLLALDPPNIDVITTSLVTPLVSCTGALTNTSSDTTSAPGINLGQGSFIPTQFFVSPSGATAYILGKLQAITSISAATQSGTSTVYTYTLVSGPPLQVGQSIVIAGMQASADNGGFTITNVQAGTFAVSNPFGTSSAPTSSGASGTVNSRLPFVIIFNVNPPSSSQISLANAATPLSMSLSPAGDFLFVGADDGTVHVIDTGLRQDTQQVTFPFPTNELCFGPGNPATQVPLSQVSISAVSQSGANAIYSYALISGPGLKVGESITVAKTSEGGDNGTFTISALGTDVAGNPTFTVANSLAVAATGQSGVGTVPIACSPDLIAVRP